jgi:hypothetical protein
MFVDGDLIDIIKTNMILACEHNISITELEAMVPFEREILIMLLLAHLESKKKDSNN